MMTGTPITATHLLSLDDGYRYDLVEGELYRSPFATLEQGMLAAGLLTQLGNFVVARRLGQVFASETGFQLSRDPDTVLGPDAAFIRAERLPARKTWRDGYGQLAPDLVAEFDAPLLGLPLDRKVATYLAAGVALVWTVHSRRLQVIVYRTGRAPRILGINDTLDGEDVLPGFRLPLSDLFRELP